MTKQKKQKRLWLCRDVGEYEMWRGSEPPRMYRDHTFWHSTGLNKNGQDRDTKRLYGFCSKKFDATFPQFQLRVGQCIPLRSTKRGLVRGDKVK